MTHDRSGDADPARPAPPADVGRAPVTPVHAVSEQAVSDQAVSDQAVSAQPASAQPASVFAVSDRAASVHSGSAQTAPGPAEHDGEQDAPIPLPSRRAADPSAAADEELLRVLHEQHAAALWGFVLHLTGGDRNRAEDVVQETLFRAWRKPAVLAQKDASARGWLFTVARNIVVDDWRSAQRRPTTSAELLPELLQPDGTDTAVQSIMVAEALRRLTRDHRAVLLECYFRGCTAAQAAARLGVPVGTVKSRLHYALHALRLVFQEMGVVT